MPTVALSISAGEGSGLEELAGAPPLIQNLLTEAITGALRTRPGIAAWSSFPAYTDADTVESAVIGMYPLDDKTLVYVTENRRIWALDVVNQVIAPLTTITDAADAAGDDVATALDGSLRPTFTATSNGDTALNKLIIAGGSSPQAWTGAGVTARLANTIAPGAVTSPMSHVTSIALRIVGNHYGPPGFVEFTSTDNSTDWSGDFEAEASTDPAVAVATNTNELFVWGTRTLQVYVPETLDAIAGGAESFALARTLNIGCSAPYSIVPIDDGFAWLTDKRQIISSNARGFTAISAPFIDRRLGQITDVSDAWAFRARMDAFDLQCWVFPTDHRIFCYEATSKTWSEWRSHTGGATRAPVIQSYVFWPEQNLHLVGLSDGTVGLLDMTTAIEDGQQLVTQLHLGFEDHDTHNKKHCQSIAVHLRRGYHPVSADAPTLKIEYRDGLGAFGPPMYGSLGVLGDTDTSLEWGPLGTYRTRQYRLTASSAYPLVLGKCFERYETLEV